MKRPPFQTRSGRIRVKLRPMSGSDSSIIKRVSSSKPGTPANTIVTMALAWPRIAAFTANHWKLSGRATPREQRKYQGIFQKSEVILAVLILRTTAVKYYNDICIFVNLKLLSGTQAGQMK